MSPYTSLLLFLFPRSLQKPTRERDPGVSRGKGVGDGEGEGKGVSEGIDAGEEPL